MIGLYKKARIECLKGLSGMDLNNLICMCIYVNSVLVIYIDKTKAENRIYQFSNYNAGKNIWQKLNKIR